MNLRRTDSKTVEIPMLSIPKTGAVDHENRVPDGFGALGAKSAT